MFLRKQPQEALSQADCLDFSMNFSFCKFTDEMNGHNWITETADVGENETQQIKIL